MDLYPGRLFFPKPAWNLSFSLSLMGAAAFETLIKIPEWLGGQWLSGLAPPSAQGLIESHVGLPAWSLLLPLPVSLPLSLYVSH